MSRPFRLALLALTTLLALGVVLALLLAGGDGHPTRGPSPSSPSTAGEVPSAAGFDGAALPPGVRAPAWTLSDDVLPPARRVALRDFSGQVLILTFLSPTATGAGPLIAQQIRGALDDLVRPAPAVAISADPTLDAPARVRGFLARNSLSGRLTYLTGPPAQLRSLWHAYRVAPLSAGRADFEAAATVLLIDPRGYERVVFGLEQLTPEGLAHDVERLRG
jgi:protein SCO1/2